MLLNVPKNLMMKSIYASRTYAKLTENYILVIFSEPARMFEPESAISHELAVVGQALA